MMRYPEFFSCPADCPRAQVDATAYENNLHEFGELDPITQYVIEQADEFLCYARQHCAGVVVNLQTETVECGLEHGHTTNKPNTTLTIVE